ncbi:MAG: YkgJ family cysteine cluster protein [Rhodospirillaceae bacterium]|nr:YkgJ family cysteine cluster protein [Rhodospirillaceae bacterium]
MDRHFKCTACGKCCFGKLPLSINDAIANVGRFPLAIMWSTVRAGAKSFALNARLGTTIQLGKRKQIAVQITPISYMPPSLSCPALLGDGMCAIHDNKPLRCKTMPFYPYREENDQLDLLVPRPGWLCDTSDQAPVVYRDKKIVDPNDFKRERKELNDQAQILREYADGLMARAPNVAAEVEKAATKPQGGMIILNFTTIISRLKQIDMETFAKEQFPLMNEFAAKTKNMKKAEEFHQYYVNAATAMEKFLARKLTSRKPI